MHLKKTFPTCYMQPVHFSILTRILATTVVYLTISFGKNINLFSYGYDTVKTGGVANVFIKLTVVFVSSPLGHECALFLFFLPTPLVAVAGQTSPFACPSIYPHTTDMIHLPCSRLALNPHWIAGAGKPYNLLNTLPMASFHM